MIFTLFVFCVSVAWAEDSENKFMYACNVNKSKVELGPIVPEHADKLKKLGYVVEEIATYELINYTPEDENGNVTRD
ncbi:MAG TPA: hypothetical protein VIU46_05705, partial [Gallionellaceae bacterium]